MTAKPPSNNVCKTCKQAKQVSELKPTLLIIDVGANYVNLQNNYHISCPGNAVRKKEANQYRATHLTSLYYFKP